MNYNEQNTIPITQPNTGRTYTAVEIATEHNVTDAAVRTGWYKWLCKVAPSELLKSGKRYTELAHALFSEFAQVDPKERPAWVADAKHRYAHEWGRAGVIDCEIVPENVGGVLALHEASNNHVQQEISVELAQVQQFIEQLNLSDANLSQAEMEGFVAAGTRRAIAQFRAEEIARAQTLSALRQQRLQGGKDA
ncbi:MAG: hypothetical protein AAFR12_05335 [Cyanobacteria bacterium J06626_6]